jgi:hypothetical protein
MAVRIFIPYSHKDEDYRNQLDAQLAILRRAGIVEIWHDRRLVAGEEWDHAIKSELEAADIILLLVSPDFLNSNYIWDVEIARAMQRHETGEARVIPVILRPCAWDIASFAKLQALPKDGKPVSMWANTDEALLDIVNGIRRAVEQMGWATAAPRPATHASSKPDGTSRDLPRSGNLRITKRFTDHDKDRFLHDAFEYIQRYFEGSLAELAARNKDVRTTFRPIDAERFISAIYRGGEKEAACTVRIGGMFGERSITYCNTDSARGNSCNEALSVGADDQALYLKPMGMSSIFRGGGRDEKLSMEGGAELLWSLLIEPLQRGGS